MTESVDYLILSEPTKEHGHALLKWVDELEGRIVRGDMVLGILTVEDVLKAPAAMRRAVDCGLPEAWLNLANWLTAPPIGAPDLDGAEIALKHALKAEVQGANVDVAKVRWFYRREEATLAEREETFELLSQAIATDPDDSDAVYLKGLLTCAGFGTEADPKSAVSLQNHAADLGHTGAMFELYVHHATGLGVEANDDAALAANRRAAEAGHPRATYNMGAFYATGRHVEQDMAQAAEWYERASGFGNARATMTLAVMYASGDGVEKDLEYAEELFGMAEALGLDVDEIRASFGL